MVEIQLYRAMMGTFTLKHHFKSKCNPRALRSNNRLREDSNFLFITKFSISVYFYLLVLVAAANLETFNNFKTKAIQRSGDIEPNTGPKGIIRSVQSSFSEGNVLLLGKTSG